MATGSVPRTIDFTPSADLYSFESRWFESSVGPVHYVDEGSGQPIVFLHGNPTWSFLYRNIMRGLRDNFRCIAVDYPGFGLSVRPKGYGCTPREHAVIVGKLVDHLNLDQFIVTGQDWGGPIGLSVAASRADRIAGLIAGNTWFWPVDLLRAKIFSILMSSQMGRRLILHQNLFVERFIPLGTARSLSREEMDQYRGVQPSAWARFGVAEFPRQLRHAHPWLAGLAEAVPQALGNKPLLLVWGMRDFAFVPKHYIPRWQNTFPDNVLVELKNAKHYIQEDAPEEIAGAIRRRFG